MRLGFRHQRSVDCHPDCANLLSEYTAFLRDCKGLAPSTVRIREKFVAAFLSDGLKHRCAPGEMVDLHPSIIHDHVIYAGKPLNRASRKQLVSSLRSILRFLLIKGYVSRDLASAVPVIPISKLDRLPRGIAWEDVQKLLTATNRDTLAGRRHYAVLLLVATYGVRIGQIRALSLKDIDWDRRLISFVTLKKGKPLCFPLQAEVAEALLDYLSEDRSDVESSRVFLTVKGPRRPLGDTNSLHDPLKRLWRLAGVNAPVIGAHSIRHAFATRLTQQGVPMKNIADLLGHRSLESTFVYTKVDLPRLRVLADEWPKEVR
jgi:integrase/recombinase XerD